MSKVLSRPDAANAAGTAPSASGAPPRERTMLLTGNHAVGNGIGFAQSRQVHITRRQPHHLRVLRDAILALAGVSKGNDDGSRAGPHIGDKTQSLRGAADSHLQARSRGAVLMETPRQLQHKRDTSDERCRLGAGRRRHALARTLSVAPSTATTCTVLPNGRSGPSTSH